MHVHKKYKTRVGDRQRKSGFCGILAQKVSVRPYARINYAPLSNLLSKSVRIITSVTLDSSQTYILANEKQVRP